MPRRFFSPAGDNERALERLQDGVANQPRNDLGRATTTCSRLLAAGRLD